MVRPGPLWELQDEEIETRQKAVAARLGFTLADHSLTLHGHCVREDCPYREKT
mgnify:CR=1 FL=1